MAQQTSKGDLVVTCTAPVNIAVIKYWGKKDEDLIIPINSSLSATLSQDDLCTTTTVLASSELQMAPGSYEIILNGAKEDSKGQRVENVFKAVRTMAQAKPTSNFQLLQDKAFRIVSSNNFPTAAGLASSAAGFCCLCYSLAQIYGLLDGENDTSVLSEISKIARVGSGSACRSVFGGWAKWEMGTRADGEDSIAVPVLSETHWPEICVLILVVSGKKKETGSTVGMQNTVNTSKLIHERVKEIPARIEAMESALKEKNFDKFAAITIMDSDNMHATCADTVPSIVYLNDTSRMIQQIVKKFNEVNGKNEIAYTFDAGPNAFLFCERQNLSKTVSLINHYFPGVQHKQSTTSAATVEVEDISKYTTEIDKVEGVAPIPQGLNYVIHTRLGCGPKVLPVSNSLVDLETREPKNQQ